MGVEYTLVNLKGRVMFDLGKSGWVPGEALRKNPRLTLDELKTVIREWWGKAPEPETTQFVDWYAPRLIAFVAGLQSSDLEVVDDCGDDETKYRDLGFPVIDCRYSDPAYHPEPCTECKSAEMTQRSGKPTVFHTRFCSQKPRHETWEEYEKRTGFKL